jgi:nucleotide-binding universal stress UspA family protein
MTMEKNKIKKILVPVDFSETSETATTNAIILAKLLKADVLLICVIEHNWHHIAAILKTQAPQPSMLDIEAAVERKMNELQEKISRKFGITPEVYFPPGHIHSEIISYAEEREIDLIVMGTHGVSGYNELFMGTTAQRVVTHSKVPVLTMHKECNKPGFKNILIPIDNSMHSREKVNMAIFFGHLFGATMHILGLPDSENEQELNKFNTKIKSVEEILGLSKLPKKTTMAKGDNLAEEALNYAAANKCDLIVINTGHESVIAGIFLNTFTQQIVNHSKIPVLSIKHTPGHYRVDSPGSPDL